MINIYFMKYMFCYIHFERRGHFQTFVKSYEPQTSGSVKSDINDRDVTFMFKIFMEQVFCNMMEKAADIDQLKS